MSSQLSLEREAQRRVKNFRHKFGLMTLHLAYHAALPVVLDADLLHLLRINFFLDLPGSLPATAETDLLFSSLCKEIDEDLYEIAPEIRKVLLRDLLNEPAYGERRIREIATLLWQFSNRYTPWADRPTLERAQQLTALNFLEPERAAEWLKEVEEQPALNATDGREWFVAMRKELELVEQAFLTAETQTGTDQASDEHQTSDIEAPPGFKLVQTLSSVTGPVGRIAWSPNGELLAAPSADGTVYVWDTTTGRTLHSLTGHTKRATSVAWSPDGVLLASSSDDGTIRLWQTATGKLQEAYSTRFNGLGSIAWSPDGRVLAFGSNEGSVNFWDLQEILPKFQVDSHPGLANSLAWSPDGRTLASGSEMESLIRFWDAVGKPRRVIMDSGKVLSLAWSSDGRTLASGSSDSLVCLWDAERGVRQAIFEGHKGPVNCVAFSPDGRLLASKSFDETIRLWRCETGEIVATLSNPDPHFVVSGLAFHPQRPMLATLAQGDTAIRIWQFDPELLLGSAPSLETHSNLYRTAKVILLGDVGTGKSGLAMALTGQAFQPTDSTHGRRIWQLDSQTIHLADGGVEQRDIMLWDLAGQPGYRLIHQLHLNEVAVALIVFDARSETEPFSGVRHWDRALRQAQKSQAESAPPLKKYLIAARADRGGIAVSRERIEATVRDLGFDGYFETSAREGWYIAELVRAIRDGIIWDSLPGVISTELWQTIKAFLITEKEAGRLLSTAEHLYRSFCQTRPDLTNDKELRAKFEACIASVENRGLIRRLSFGGYVLLQPELLDAYASAMVIAARSEPDGLGCIAEEDALAGRFGMPTDERIAQKDQEKLILIATIEELMRHEIVLKESTETGIDLVFPSQITRERPDMPEWPGKSVVFTFDGPVLSVYGTLTVRLSKSGAFKKKDMWRNAATYTSSAGGVCGISIREIEEGSGELTLFFDAEASEATRFQFEEYIATHLRRRALPETLRRQRVFVCPTCGTPVAELAAARRRERGFDWIACNVCDPPTRISLLDREERLASSSLPTILEMDRAADSQRARETAASILKGKIETGDYDVFLCCNSADKPVVKKIGELLKEHGILPWLDEWEVQPGHSWHRDTEEYLSRIRAAAVFVGKEGIGPWQHEELEALLRNFVLQGSTVIPVILPDVSDNPPRLPSFLANRTWVDFRQRQPNPLERLIWGITGERISLSDEDKNHATHVLSYPSDQDAPQTSAQAQQRGADFQLLDESVNAALNKARGMLRPYQRKIVDSALKSTLRAFPPYGNLRAGIVSQVIGSGLGMSTITYLLSVMAETGLRYPIIVAADRVLIAKQLYQQFDSFLGSAALFVSSITELRESLFSGQNRLIFTTSQRLSALNVSNRQVLLVCCDLHGKAGNLRKLLPNATLMLFTGTPVTQDSTVTEIFGEVVGNYTLKEAISDNVVLPLHIEKRIIEPNIKALEFAGNPQSNWTMLLRGPRYLKRIAQDIIDHFESRQKLAEGKALIVVPNLEIAFALHSEILQLRPEWRGDLSSTDLVVVISSAQKPEYQASLFHHFYNPDSPTRLAIISSTSMTGLDNSLTNTAYILKPISANSLLRIIGRINQPYKNKDFALIVDYIGLDKAIESLIGS